MSLPGNVVENSTAYAYDDEDHPYAVTGLSNDDSYTYDANGNMTSRKWNGSVQTLTYDIENWLTGVTGSGTGSFVYDAQGARVKGTVNSQARWYMGDWYEWTGSAGDKYYYLGGLRVAMRDASGNVNTIHGDHLTSAMNTTGSGSKSSTTGCSTQTSRCCACRCGTGAISRPSSRWQHATSCSSSRGTTRRARFRSNSTAPSPRRSRRASTSIWSSSRAESCASSSSQDYREPARAPR